MFNPKKGLMKAASVGRRRILSPSTLTAEKGHFVVYTVDQVRFVIPLPYLEHGLFQKLLRVSEEEFRVSIDGPITVPCDAASMEYMVLLIKRGVTKDLEIKAMLDSIIAASSCSNFTSNQECFGPNMVVCGCN